MITRSPARRTAARGSTTALRRVLLLCWRDTGHPEAGGSERYLAEIAAPLAADGVAVTLLTARYPGSAAREVRDGVDVIRRGGRLTVYPWAWVLMLLARVHLGPLAGQTPDVVLDVQNGVPFFARVFSGRPVALLVHHVHQEQWPVAGRVLGRIGWWVESVLSPRVHRDVQWVTVSTPSAREIVALGAPAGRVAVVRNGLDPVPAGRRPGPAPVPTVCVLSRLVPHKQVEDVLVAAAALREALPDLVVDVLGEGWWAPRLAERTVELGLQDVVRFHGHVTEERKHEVLDAAWVHAMPSRKEGWGLAVLEAAAHAVPTVGYRSSGGLTDSVVDGVTGVLVDDRDELTGVLGALLSDPVRRTELGRRARERSAGFSWAVTAAGLRHVLETTATHRPVVGVVGAVSAAS